MADRPPLRYQLDEQAGVLVIRVSGYATGAASSEYLEKLWVRLRRAATEKGCTMSLLFVDGLSGFEMDAAKAHGLWFARHNDVVRRVGIVSTKLGMSMAVSVAMLLTRIPLKVFPTEADAMKWLST